MWNLKNNRINLKINQKNIKQKVSLIDLFIKKSSDDKLKKVIIKLDNIPKDIKNNKKLKLLLDYLVAKIMLKLYY